MKKKWTGLNHLVLWARSKNMGEKNFKSFGFRKVEVIGKFQPA